MESGGVFLLGLVPLFIAAIILIRVAAAVLDRGRIQHYVESRGGRFMSAAWAPFGPGWFGGNRERIYLVRFYDHDGNEHEAYVRTSMWAGVYFTEDHVVHPARDPIDERDIESLEEENARLRAELARLKRREHQHGSDAFQE
jgi:hypothetical protein